MTASSSYYVGSRGYYWSRTLDSGGGWLAFSLYFNSVGSGTYDFNRRFGQSVRAVLAP